MSALGPDRVGSRVPALRSGCEVVFSAGHFSLRLWTSRLGTRVEVLGKSVSFGTA